MYTDADEILQEEINQYKVKARQPTQLGCSVVFTNFSIFCTLVPDSTLFVHRLSFVVPVAIPGIRRLCLQSVSMFFVTSA